MKRSASGTGGVDGGAGIGGGSSGASGASGSAGASGSGGASGSSAAGGASGSGGAGGSDGGTATCPSGMVFGATNTFCIDSTEVPRVAYANWLAKSPSTAGQDTWCAFNQDFAPNSTSGDCTTAQFLDPLAPQNCVDWCDAFAYCKAAGKRLCGQIGGPGAVTQFNVTKADFSQWVNACSDGGTRAHPYGAFQAGKCNDQTAGVAAPAKVPYKSGGCPGGVSGLYDMSGNVKEWVDSCTSSSESAQCFLLGGSYASSTAATLQCSAASSASRNANNLADVGFRCCVDVP